MKLLSMMHGSQSAIDDPQSSVPHEEVKTRFAAKKAALLKGI
ncbi:hypothetical protein [Photorhabdus laumondii]|nr:hypothetical protein [Photorhabdus laumondii]